MLVAACWSHAATAQPTVRQREVVWHKEWTPVSPLEVGGTVAFTALNMVLFPGLTGPSSAAWNGGFALDDPVRDMFRLRSRSQQLTTARYSDIGFRTLALFPYVVDVGVAALAVHRAPRVAFEMALIDADALTLAGTTQLLTSRLLGRRRPYVRECKGDGSAHSERCGTNNDNRSFYSGHAAGSFTSAWLTCLHHEYLPLYGGGPVESWACVWALSLASATSIFRITSDNHYASDVVVVVGAAMGYLYGYALPKWLHYGRLRNPTAAGSELFTNLQLGLVPANGDGASLLLGGRF